MKDGKHSKFPPLCRLPRLRCRRRFAYQRPASCLLWSLGFLEWIMIVFPRPRGWIVVLRARLTNDEKSQTTDNNNQTENRSDENGEKLGRGSILVPQPCIRMSFCLPVLDTRIQGLCESCAVCRLPDWTVNFIGQRGPHHYARLSVNLILPVLPLLLIQQL